MLPDVVFNKVGSSAVGRSPKVLHLPDFPPEMERKLLTYKEAVLTLRIYKYLVVEFVGRLTSLY
jgi:hypothetical protein